MSTLFFGLVFVICSISKTKAGVSALAPLITSFLFICSRWDFHRITGITKGFPVHATLSSVTVIAAQGFGRGLHPVKDAKVPCRVGPSVLSVVNAVHLFRGQLHGRINLAIHEEMLNRDGYNPVSARKQRQPRPVNFEGKYLRFRIISRSLGHHHTN
jgi:hypothetical protein